MKYLKPFSLFEESTNEGPNVTEFKVRGYIRPAAAFKTIEEWEKISQQILDFQKDGMSIRGGEITGEDKNSEEFLKFNTFLLENFGYILTTEIERFPYLTRKIVLDFIEDFVNHRVWGLHHEYKEYFKDITKLRFGNFYSRGAIEPYVMIDDEFTAQTYGSLDNEVEVNHYTMHAGLANLQDSIETGNKFDISSFTQMKEKYFRKESVILVKMKANLRAAFRSDVKSLALDNGKRAANLLRFDYPGEELNICDDIKKCLDVDLKTSLWNELIVTPIEIISTSEA